MYFGTLPPAVPMSRAPEVFETPRSTLYKLAGEGRIVLVKRGRTTLVLTQSFLEYLKTLPRAEIGGKREKAA